MELLLISSRWPNAEVTEFLDEEIKYLAQRFSRIIVAPMRPRGPITAPLPAHVVVDYTLAGHLIRNRLSRTRTSRTLTAAGRAAQPNGAGLGFQTSELVRDGRRPGWIRQALLSRADSRTVALWASARRPPNLAYTFWLGAATVGLRQAWPEVPLVSRVHGGDLFSEAHGWSSIPYQAAALDSADLVASVSERGRNYLIAKFPRSRSRVTCRRLGIPDLGNPSVPAHSEALRLLSASSIDENKRVFLIAQVALALAALGRSVRWTHIGDGPNMAAVEQVRVDRPPGLTVNLPGQVPLSEVHRQLTSGDFDVFINLSLSEGAPVSLMEAQCVGLPVVATDVGGSAEVVPRELNELVPADESLANLCLAVLRAAARPKVEYAARRRRWSQQYNARGSYSAWADELWRLASDGIPGDAAIPSR